MLTPFDDYPVHQTAYPLAHLASGDRNQYDRFFFNGYDTAGEVFFAFAMGVYPNRQVIDAAFSVVRGGTQRSVRASGRAPLDRTRTEVGPLRVEVVEPMRHHVLHVEAADLGVEATLSFKARTAAFEEPHFTLLDGPRTVFDYTRLSQWGSWSGTIVVDGESLTIDDASHRGTRDRSWGVRPVGEAPGGAPAHRLPQFFWLWAPVNFDDGATHFDVSEDADGRRHHVTAVTLPLLPADGDPVDPDCAQEMRSVAWHIDWEPGTRRSRAAKLTFEPWEGEPFDLVMNPILDFPMKGIGYLHPEWGHGRWRDELLVGTDGCTVADLDPEAPENVHVQQLVSVRRTSDGATGLGVLEQLAINEHRPSGLTGFFDGFRP